MIRHDYETPATGTPLRQEASHLNGETGAQFRLETVGSVEIAWFEESDSAALALNERLYSGEAQNQIYRNFLDWLYRTFRTTEAQFRRELTDRLTVPTGARILVTGCGNGDDLQAIFSAFPDPSIRLWAQDISPQMVTHTARRFDGESRLSGLSVSDACSLPHPDGFFDLVYHFGGINFMPDRDKAIAEMTRVARDGGQIFFGDEGVAPWLRNSEYAEMMIANIGNWSQHVPLDALPAVADQVTISWILGNCFYLVSYFRNDGFPNVDIDVPHLGRRGGSIRTRYFGQLEGIDPATKTLAVAAAAKAGVSLSQWLTTAIERAIEAP